MGRWLPEQSGDVRHNIKKRKGNINDLSIFFVIFFISVLSLLGKQVYNSFSQEYCTERFHLAFIYLLCTDWTCFFRLPCVVAWWSQWLQEYLIFSCTDWICVFRCSLLVAWWSHWFKEYLIFSCTDWMYRLNMSPQISLFCKLMVTLITRIFDFFMNWLNMAP